MSRVFIYMGFQDAARFLTQTDLEAPLRTLMQISALMLIFQILHVASMRPIR